MTLEVIRRWYNNLPPEERNLPLIIYNGVAYSPHAILMEVERGTQLGEYLQRKVEMGSLGTTKEELKNLALIRLKMILSKYPPNTPLIASLTYPPKVYTAQELLKELDKGTPIAERLIQTEEKHALDLLKLVGR